MKVETEEWHPIPQVVGRYEVSSLGRVRSLLGGAPQILKPTPQERGGYLRVKLSGWPTGTGNRYIHHIAAEVFVGPRPAGMEIRHRDGNVANNAAGNLAYGTAEENAEDRRLHGTQHRGERTGGAKLSESDVLAIREKLEAGCPAAHLAMLHEVSPSTITDIRKRRTWGWLVTANAKGTEAAA